MKIINYAPQTVSIDTRSNEIISSFNEINYKDADFALPKKTVFCSRTRHFGS